MRHSILSIGELLWDVLPDQIILGGAPANLAFRLLELGCECQLVSRLGKDEPGDKALEVIKKMGIPTKFIQRDPHFPTGTVIVDFDKNRNPDYVITPEVAYDFIESSPELEVAAAKCHCIAFGTLAQRSDKTRETIYTLIENAVDAVKFLDINLRKDCYSLESIDHSLHLTDILKTNHQEAFQLNNIFDLSESALPALCEKLSDRFKINTMLVTMEQNGVFLYDTQEGKHYIPGYQIVLEDPLGAGDAFSAGFIKELLSGSSLKNACETGNLLGANVASKKGATENNKKDELKKIATQNNRVIDHSLSKFR